MPTGRFRGGVGRRDEVHAIAPIGAPGRVIRPRRPVGPGGRREAVRERRPRGPGAAMTRRGATRVEGS